MMRTRTRRGACRRGNFVLSCCCFLKDSSGAAAFAFAGVAICFNRAISCIIHDRT